MEDELVAHGQNEPFSCSKWNFFGPRALPIWRGICHGQSMQTVPQNCWNLWGEALVATAKNGHRPRLSIPMYPADQFLGLCSCLHIERQAICYLYLCVGMLTTFRASQLLGPEHSMPFWLRFDSICVTLVDCKRDSFRWLFELILCELVVWNVGNTKRHCNPPPVISNDGVRHFSHLRSLVQA